MTTTRRLTTKLRLSKYATVLFLLAAGTALAPGSTPDLGLSTPQITGSAPSPLGAALARVGAAPLSAQESIHRFIGEARPILDVRLRYEFVDQASFEHDAHALTLRGRMGAESGEVAGFRLLLEGDLTRAVGAEDFNSTVNGRVTRPVVPDPDSERINRAHLTWQGGGWTAIAGRQRIVHDHARFVGNVGFRQNEQTYDGIRIQTPLTAEISAEYAHLWQVNRVFGSNSAFGTEGISGHLVRLSRPSPLGTLSAHGYWLDFDDALVARSNRTLGVRLTGDRPLPSGWTANWAAALSRQHDHGSAPREFSLDYAELRAGLARGGLSVTLGVEVMEGDGEQGFATPLATLHAFQGFADLFLTTPPDGLVDRHLVVGYRIDDLPRIGGLRLGARFHDFAVQGSATGSNPTDLGREWNASASLHPRSNWDIVAEYADHSGFRLNDSAASPGAVTKFWFGTTVRIP